MKDTPDYLRSIVTELAGEVGARPFRDLARLERAAELVERQFADFGYAVASQSFEYSGRSYRNLIAERAGSEEPEKVLVVGAHYDTVPETPGADDNASGVAGLLGLARLLADRPLRKTVRFAAFALEEPPVFRTRNMGSYRYAESLKRVGTQVEGMVCLEMIGYFTDRPGSQRYPLPFMNRVFPRTGSHVVMVGNRRSAAFTRAMSEGFRGATDLPVFTLNAPAIVVGIDFSDHWSFGKFGYPALMVTDTAFYRNPNYHTPADLPETLDYGSMAKVVEGLAGSIESWSRKQVLRPTTMRS
jgi:Zn-dependent M28 family amino/carboxypeptidase